MRIFYAALLVLLLSSVGCEFSRWATRTDPVTGRTPVAEAGTEIARDTLTGFEAGGIYAGLAALLFTTGKTGLRLYQRYEESKKGK